MKRYENHEPEDAVHNLPDYNIDIVAHRSITDSSFAIMSSMVSLFSITVFSNLLRIKWKRKRSDSVLWQKPLHQKKCKKGKVTTQTTPQKKFDYTAVADRLRTVIWSNYGYPIGVVDMVYGPSLPTPRNSREIKRTHV